MSVGFKWIPWLREYCQFESAAESASEVCADLLNFHLSYIESALAMKRAASRPLGRFIQKWVLKREFENFFTIQSDELPMRLVPPSLESANVSYLPDGSLYCERFGDVYSSASGAVEQARHVFLAGTDFPSRCVGTRAHTVVETGFGAGINFLVAWQAWRGARAARGADAWLHYVAVEKHPFTRAALRSIYQRCGVFDDLTSKLLEVYPSLVPGFHRLNLDHERLTLTLLFGEAADLLSQLDASVDSFFLDGFAPAKNPDMWSDAVFAQLARLASTDARAATYTVAGAVRAGLEKAGFTVAKQRGFAAKREMLVARFRNGKPKRIPPASAIIIGGGLAGTACAHRLAARGVKLTLFERHAAVGKEASGNPTGLLRPHLAVDWIPQVDLSLGSFLYSARALARLAAQGDLEPSGRLDGVVHIAADAVRTEKIMKTLTQMGMPSDVVRRIDAREASEQAGVPAASGGWFYPQGGWVDPARICAAQLAQAGARVEYRFGEPIEWLQHIDGAWQMLNAKGEVLAESELVIIANAHAALKFEQCARLPIRPVRGQLTYIRRCEALLRAVCGDGYVTPASDGVHCVGASYNEGLFDPALRAEDSMENLRRLRRILPNFCDGELAQGGRVSFRTMSVDLLPVCGELAPGLYASLALGSRGIALAPLLAEAIASEVLDEPAPIPRSLLRSMHPARFTP
jgi:tRNA 5-methylaminomethyl-2-thiouridine biosynthesis bifunctional protein